MANPEPPRTSLDARVDELHRRLEEEKMRSALAREEGLAAARMTHPEIKRKRRTVNVLIVGAAVLVLGVVFYFMFRPGPKAEHHADDAAWSLPPPEPLPDAPELPDLSKKATTARPHVHSKSTAPRDILGDIGEDTRDPIGR
jgi:hypothetical protein